MNQLLAKTLLLLPALVLGAAPAAAAVADGSTLINDSLRLTWGLLIVLAVMFVIYLLAKKRLALLQGGGKGVIKIVETRHLMPKKTLFLVQVRGQEFLLGSGSDRIELIARLDGRPEQQSFDELLNNAGSEQSS